MHALNQMQQTMAGMALKEDVQLAKRETVKELKEHVKAEMEPVNKRIDQMEKEVASSRKQVHAIETKHCEELARVNVALQQLSARVAAQERQHAQSSRAGAANRASSTPGRTNLFQNQDCSVVITGFPFPMWRKNLIEYAKSNCAASIPSH